MSTYGDRRRNKVGKLHVSSTQISPLQQQSQQREQKKTVTPRKRTILKKSSINTPTQQTKPLDIIPSKKSALQSLLDDDDEDDDFVKGFSTDETKIALEKKISATTSTLKASVRETGNDTMRSYLKSMGTHELLRAEDEIVLGRQIQTLVKWEEVKTQLEETLCRTPTDAEWAKALSIPSSEHTTQIRRSQRAKAALIEANLRLVVSIARQIVRNKQSDINFQDACQEGIIGLSRACDKFDPEKGFRFSTYANWWIKREVMNSCTEQKYSSIRLPYNVVRKVNLIRITEVTMKEDLGRKPRDDELATKLEMTVQQLEFYRKASQDAFSLDKTMKSQKGKGSRAGAGGDDGSSLHEMLPCNEATPTDNANSEMLKSDVSRLIRTLSPKEQAVIRLRFGLDDGKVSTLADIGGKFGVSVEKVRKIEASALLKLRQPYRNQSVKCYISDL